MAVIGPSRVLKGPMFPKRKNTKTIVVRKRWDRATKGVLLETRGRKAGVENHVGVIRSPTDLGAW